MIGSYGKEQEPDEHDDEKIKEKQDQMMVLIEENAKAGIGYINGLLIHVENLSTQYLGRGLSHF